MRRSLPKDPLTPVAFGWCYRTPRVVPRTCSWCGETVTFTRGGAVICPDCDAPPAHPEWDNQPEIIA